MRHFDEVSQYVNYQNKVLSRVSMNSKNRVLEGENFLNRNNDIKWHIQVIIVLSALTLRINGIVMNFNGDILPIGIHNIVPRGTITCCNGREIIRKWHSRPRILRTNTNVVNNTETLLNGDDTLQINIYMLSILMEEESTPVTGKTMTVIRGDMADFRDNVTGSREHASLAKSI